MTSLFRAASALYRRALGTVDHAVPRASADEAAAVFDALQRESYATGGWRALGRCWASELGAIAGLRFARAASAPVPSAPSSRGAAMSSLRHDLRDAFRSIRHAPGYTAMVTLMLALGIGANTAIFSVVDALLFKAQPYANADRLVLVVEWPRTGGNWTAAPTVFAHWRETAHSFSEIEARFPQNFNVIEDGDPEEVRGARVTPGYFELLGIRTAAGRTLQEADTTPGGPCVAVISNRLWTRRLGADPAAVGRDMRFAGRTCTVLGVLPAESVFDRGAPEIYVPLAMSPAEAASEGRQLTVIARLRDGVTVEQASREMAALAETFNPTRGAAGRNWTAMAIPWRDVLVRADARQLVWVLFGAVVLVLAIACANVAGLSLSRTIGRRREIAVRAALGAGRGRLFRALVVESLVLAAIGGAISLALGTWTLRMFVALVPPGTLPIEASPSLDGRALAFTMLACLLTGVLAGVLPAWQAGRMTLTETLAAAGRGFSAAPRTAWLQSTLLVVELALAMVLVTGAALLTVSFSRLLAVPPGFAAADVLTFRASAPPARYATDAQVADFHARIRASIQAIPSVQAVGAATSLPLGGWLFGTRFGIEGAPMDQERLPAAHIQHVTPGYFEALKIGLAAGRTFTAADDARAAQVVIVNETLARRFVPGGPALGRILLMDSQATGRPTPQWEIVGVIHNVKTYDLADADDSTPEIYVPHAQLPAPVLYFAVRAAQGDPSRLVPDIRAAVRSVDPDVPIGNVMPMDDRLGISVRLQRFRTATIAAFAGLAALLACLGAYAVRSRAVAARAREMGIRVALGATRRQVITLALAQGVRLAALGLAIGWVASYVLSGLVRQWLFQTRATDPAIAMVAVVLLGGAALAASWAPARRAASVDPLKVLRDD